MSKGGVGITSLYHLNEAIEYGNNDVVYSEGISEWEGGIRRKIQVGEAVLKRARNIRKTRSRTRTRSRSRSRVRRRMSRRNK